MAKGRKKYITPAIQQRKSVKHPEYRTLDAYAGGRSIEDLQTIRRALAKQANQRIVRLEQAKSKITGEAFNTFGAVSDVYEYLNRKGKSRFSEQLKGLNRRNELQHEITVLQGFLSRKSSTVAGMRAIEKKRISTMEKRGLKFANTKEFYDFLNSQTFHELVTSGFTSEQIIEAYDKSREKLDDATVLSNMQEALDEFRSGEMKVSLKNLENELGIKLIKL